MGEMIEFRQTARTARARPASEATTGARILLFTGVRYERHADEPEPQTPEPSKDGTRRRRKRASA